MAENFKTQSNWLFMFAISIMFIATVMPLNAAATKVVIPNASAEQGANTTVPVMIKNATDAVSGTTIKLWFNPAVVNVTRITRGDFPGTLTQNTLFTSDGWVKVVVDVGANPSLTGDNITVVYFTLKAVGNAGSSSYLNLEVQSLLNDSFASIPFTAVNGTFTVTGASPPTAATKVVIPNASAEQGANTTVPVMTKNATDAVSGTTIKLWFNPAVVNVTRITRGDFPGTLTQNTLFTSDGWVKVVVDVGANPSLTGDNITVAYFTLKAVGNAGSSSYLNLEVQSLLNDSFASIPFTAVNSTFTVTAPLDILSYYRRLGSDPNVVETTDLLKAADDWSRDIAPPGFTVPITTVQLLALADEWSRS